MYYIQNTAYLLCNTPKIQCIFYVIHQNLLLPMTLLAKRSSNIYKFSSEYKVDSIITECIELIFDDLVSLKEMHLYIENKTMVRLLQMRAKIPMFNR